MRVRLVQLAIAAAAGLLFAMMPGCAGARGPETSATETEEPTIADYFKHLTRQDVADLVALGTEGGVRPWRIDVNGEWSWPYEPSATLYLSPQKTTTPELRRGRIVVAEARLHDPEPGKSRGWRIVRGPPRFYAQVALPGGDFTGARGRQDLLLPFAVPGPIADDELVRYKDLFRRFEVEPFTDDMLVSLVTFIREKPVFTASKGRNVQVQGDAPIESVGLRTDGVSVRILLGSSTQIVVLQKRNSEWVVTDIGMSTS